MNEPGVEVRAAGDASRVRVLLVSNVELHRDALATRLALIGSITVVAASRAGAKALRLASALRPDVALVDVAATREPLYFVEALHAAAPALLVCVVGAPAVDPRVPDQPRDEATVLLDLEATFPELIALLTGGGAEGAALAPRSSLATLSARELEIVALIEEGLSNKQIAARLSIELATVKNHVHHILGKLELSRRGEAAALLRRALSEGE